MSSLEEYKKYLVNVYDPLDFIPVNGHGSRLYDKDKLEIIDFASGIAVNGLGQTNAILIDSLVTQANTLWHVSNYMPNIPQIELAKKLVTSTCFDKAFFCNSGTEAVEAALKLTRRYGHKNFGSNKHNIVSFKQSFHGRTLFAVSTGGQEKYCEGFEPLVSGISHGIFNDIKSAEDLINENTAAVIIEVIQAEGGVRIAKPEFIIQLRKLCDKYNCLLIVDEVQTGVGRTGKLFAYMDYPVEPDIITMAKALGCGFPIGAILIKDPYHTGFDIGSHGTTFGGNPLACSVALAAFNQISQPEFLNEVVKREQFFIEQLKQINAELDIYIEIRGKGLIIGAELKPQYANKAKDIIQLALKHGVFVLNATNDVTRFLPSLNIPFTDIELGLSRFKSALIEFKSLT